MRYAVCGIGATEPTPRHPGPSKIPVRHQQKEAQRGQQPRPAVPPQIGLAEDTHRKQRCVGKRKSAPPRRPVRARQRRLESSPPRVIASTPSRTGMIETAALSPLKAHMAIAHRARSKECRKEGGEQANHLPSVAAATGERCCRKALGDPAPAALLPTTHSTRIASSCKAPPAPLSVCLLARGPQKPGSSARSRMPSGRPATRAMSASLLFLTCCGVHTTGDGVHTARCACLLPCDKRKTGCRGPGRRRVWDAEGPQRVRRSPSRPQP